MIRNYLYLFIFAFISLFSAVPASAQLMWEMTPYKVSILYVFDVHSGALANAENQKELLGNLQNTIESRIGGFWETEILPAPSPLDNKIKTRFDAITPEDIYHSGMGSLDKALLVRVRLADSGWTIQVRDFDIRLRYLNGIVERQCDSVNNLSDSLFEALRAGFAPIGRIDDVNRTNVTLRMRGGLLGTPSPDLFTAVKDQLFAPMIRFNENDGRLKKVNPVDWTYFLVDDAPKSAAEEDVSSKSAVFCRIESGMRNALSARRRGRVEALAILVHPIYKPTVLKLVAQKELDKALRGYALYRVDPLTKEKNLAGYTDLNGEFIVQPDEKSPLHIYVIKHGDALLAQLPVLPGSQSALSAPVSDDDMRLQAEGYLLGIQEEMIDQIVLREIAMARIEAKIEKGEKEEARKILNEIRSMRTTDDFIREMESRKARFVTAQADQKERIRIMFEKTMKLLNEYMNAKRVQELEMRINNMN